MLGTKRCDRCWELETRIESDPALARKILVNARQCSEGQLEAAHIATCGHDVHMPTAGPWRIEANHNKRSTVTDGTYRYTFFGDDGKVYAVAVRDALNRVVESVRARPTEQEPR
jgi:hypothetical protein